MLGDGNDVTSSRFREQVHHLLRPEITCVPPVQKVIVGSIPVVLFVVGLTGTSWEAHSIVIPLGIRIVLVTIFVSNMYVLYGFAHTSSSGIMCN